MEDSQLSPTRRRLLASVAAALGLAGGAAGVHPADDYGVTFEYDKQWLETYQPAFVASYTTRTMYQGLYGAKATADDYEYDVAVFWLRLTHQEGLPGVSGDNHNRDHEPIYVFVKDDGSVASEVYDEWHHTAETLEGNALDNALYADRSSEPTHVPYRVVEEWHNYVPEPSSSDSEREFLDVQDFTAAIDTWEANGYFKPTSDKAVYDPISMQTRGTWWKKNTWDYTLVKGYRRVADIAGLWGGDQVSL